LAWVEETLILGSDGKGAMAVVDSQAIGENSECLRESWGIGLRGEVDETLEDIDVHRWDEVLGTSLFGMEQYLDAYSGTFVNKDKEIHEELNPPLLSSLMPPEDCNSGMRFGQGPYGGVVQDEAFLSQTHADDNISSNIPGMTSCISSFSERVPPTSHFRQELIHFRTREINKPSPSTFHAAPQTLPTATSVSRKRIRKQRIRNARPIR
jgi:hypothetical protein